MLAPVVAPPPYQFRAAGVALDFARLLPIAALGVLALLAGNGYIVGINQVRAYATM